MNVPEANDLQLNVFSSVPPRYSKNQAVFGKYAASLAGLQGEWSPGSNVFNPNSPLLYGKPVTPHVLDGVKQELMTPDSFQVGTISPNDILNPDESPLFDDIVDGNEIPEWESLFLDENVNTGKLEDDQETSNEEVINFNLDDLEMPKDSPLFNASTASGANPLQQLSTERSERPLEDPFGFSLDFSVLNEKEASPIIDVPPVDVTPSHLEETAKSPSQNPTMSGRVTKSRSNSPTTSTASKKKVDDLGITVYKRKPRSMPLKPVEVPEDCGDVAVKRAKNTEAARRSRARKLERMSQLEMRVRDLLAENERLKAELSELKGE